MTSIRRFPPRPFKIRLTAPAADLEIIAEILRMLGGVPNISPRSRRRYRLTCEVPQEHAGIVAHALARNDWRPVIEALASTRAEVS